MMKINLAHLRERAQSGGWINFAVFDARSNSGSASDNSMLLAQLVAQARRNSLNVEQAALAFRSGGRLQFFGSPSLVDYLSKRGVPAWTHQLDV
jgi:hypothetical protein